MYYSLNAQFMSLEDLYKIKAKTICHLSQRREYLTEKSFSLYYVMLHWLMNDKTVLGGTFTLCKITLMLPSTQSYASGLWKDCLGYLVLDILSCSNDS